MSFRTKPFLPYARQAIDDDDVAAVVATLRSTHLTSGPAVDAFEAALASVTGAPHVVACSSGTAALHLATLAARLGPGVAAVVPAVTFVATANAVRYVGADVIFSDVDPDTGLMRPKDLEDALARAKGTVRAVLPVHLGGRVADMEAICSIARSADLIIIEDACHALGGSVQVDGGSTPVGAAKHGGMATFSFHPVKTVTTAEGGAVTTVDAELACRLRRARSHGIHRDAGDFVNRELAFAADGSQNPWYYEMAELGLNYRASDVSCALGLSQLKKLDSFVARRAALAERYDHMLAELAPVVRPVAVTPGQRPGWHLYGVLIDFAQAGGDRAAFMTALAESGIGTQVHYIPVHWQPAYRRMVDTHLPGAQAYYERCLSLPLFPAMSDRDVDRVVEAIASVVHSNGRAASGQTVRSKSNAR